MSIEAQRDASDAGHGVISTRNGVPRESSDPPGGVPKTPDPDTHPHPVPSEGEQPKPQTDLPDNEPPPVPPRREAQGHRGHHTQQRHK